MVCSNFSQCQIENVDNCLIRKNGCLDFKGKCSIVKCEENRKVYRLATGEAKVAKYHIDGGMINNTTKKCDFMIIVYGDENKIIFVELKGRDTNHACDQLKSTIDLIGKKFTNLENKRFYARIVNTKSVPGIKVTSHYKQLRVSLNLLNSENGDYIKISSRELNESLSNI